ncbi:UPF0182 family membrane protein [Acidithrix ferrooxidans]|uniref:UPF0182 protein AXFE_31510 n=2 Tax=root TaxID=1 RepID=A0A0D8HDI9_9ACTN|nr:UPF0182 family protein [Acidithrix ferrooxidans]KJF15998.1 hypothetical protein AXFE_31510 [Acidithrix ferrooxidans]
MKRPPDLPITRKRLTKRQMIALIVAVVIIAVVLSLRGIAMFYTDYLWFRSVNLSSVWSKTLLTKVELTVVFDLIFFLGCFASLTVAEKVASSESQISPEEDLIRRFKSARRRVRILGRAGVSLLLALLVGSSATSQWRNWLLFQNSVSFNMKDPLFHKDASFYVFKLPFITFLVSWGFLALTVILLASLAFHYFNGGIRVQGQGQRVGPKVKAHLSLIVALMALLKAVGYYFQRYHLVTSTRGFVEGAGYTDVHAVLPALTLLVIISLASGGILIYNIRRRGWVLPIIAVGLWALMSVILGGIYPAVMQQFIVQPSQISKESPYIARNISATRYAFGLTKIKQSPFSYSQNLTSASLTSDLATLQAVRLWDPISPINTFNKLQDIRSYYQFNALAVDRYKISGVTTPVLLGVRELNQADLPSQSWVNLHLQFTHGYGAVLSPANAVKPDGNPKFAISDVPPVSAPGVTKITQPQVYYGLGNSSYVVGNTAQPEIDYQTQSGTSVETHYNGTGGVRLSSIVRRAAYALRYNDINLLISGLIRPNSRIIYRRNIQNMITTAAPFLHLDANPYPAIVNGRIVWIQDAYTTTSNFPYSQQGNNSALSTSSGLAGNFNYVRNSVKVVIDAYNGSMKFYVTDPRDPIIRSYESIFPGMFTPVSQAPAALVRHFRYPEDLLTVQATMYGYYHITNATAFYNAGDAWTLAQDPGTGPVTQALSTSIGQGTVAKFAPEYQLLKLPGQTKPTFNLLEPFVPVSQSGVQQNLSGFLVAGSDPSNYGQLTDFVTPRGQQIDGPALINARISATPAISQQISLLDQHGSQVSFGTTLMVPVGQSLLYIRPLYVASVQNSLPEIKQVIVVYGTQAAMEPTLAGALKDVFGTVLPGVQGANQLAAAASGTTTTVPGGTSQISPITGSNASSLIAQANQLYSQAQADLKAGNLGGYQSAVNEIGTILSQLHIAPTTTKASPTTTTAPKASASSSA